MTLDRVVRGRHILPLAMFFGTFSWSWTGWILGVSPLATVAMAPAWGRLAGRGNPKAYFVLIQFLRGAGFLAMAAATTLPGLFVSRLALGVMGAASTFAVISAGRAPDPGDVRRHVAAILSAMTVGGGIGPLSGAIAAARLGFAESFVLGGLVRFGCGTPVHWDVPVAAPAPAAVASTPARPWRETAMVPLLVLGGSTQVFFLTAILPQVMTDLGVATDRPLEIGGVIVFASGAVAALGSLAAPRLAELRPERGLIAGLLIGSSVSLAALAIAPGARSCGMLRFVQVLCIAPVFPIVVARIAQTHGGEAIGVINAARIGASFVGPVVATLLLATGRPALLNAVLALAGPACLPLSAMRAHVPVVPR